MTSTLKTIDYRGGLLRFCLPEHWVEEYEPNGGGTFFEDLPDTGMLRVDVITAESEAENGDVEQLVRALGEPELLPSKCWLLRQHWEDIQAGTALKVMVWKLVQALPPRRVRIATFSWVETATRYAQPASALHREMLDTQIRGAELAPATH